MSIEGAVLAANDARRAGHRTVSAPEVTLSLLSALGFIGATSDAIAQHCQMHGPSTAADSTESLPAQSKRPSVYVTGSWESVQYRNARYEGHFEGLLPELGFGHDGFLIAARLPAYRLLRNGLPVKGLGDATFLGQQVLLRPAPSVHLGWQAALSVPTGKSEQDLGMGHAMIMPGVFARGRWSRFNVHLGLEYARALTSNPGGHHAHRSNFPIVQPMNSQELGAFALAGLSLLEHASVRVRLQTARPFDEPHGAARTIVGLGSAFEHDGFSSSLEWQSAIEGSPFTARLSGSVTILF
jgi:hypothetical protein